MVSFQKLRAFWWVVARDVRRHRLLALFNVLSIALGIAVWLAIRIANESATRSFQSSVELVAGRANLEVRGAVDETLWPRVAAVAGVQSATGVIEGVAPLADLPGEYLHVTGVDVFTAADFQTYTIGGGFMPGDWLSTRGGVAVTGKFAREHGLARGAKLRAAVDGRIEELTVLGLIEDGELPVSDSRFAVMDIGWAQELFRRAGKLDALLLRVPGDVAPVSERVREIAPGLSVAPPERRSAQVGKMVAAFQLNLAALSMVSLLVGVFLVYNTVSASVARRRVQIGIVRALGVSRGGVRALFVGEALLYAVPGVLLGAVAGVALADKLAAAVGQTVTSLYTLVNVERLWLAPGQFIVAAIYGIAAAVVGAWGPASDAAKVEPAITLRRGGEGRVQLARMRGLWAWGSALLAAGAGCGWLALNGAPAWVAFGAALAVLLAAACFAPAMLAAVGKCASLLGTMPALVSRRLLRAARRNGITTAALAAAVAMFVALVVMVHSFRESLDAWIGKGLIADYFIAPAANETLGLTSYLPENAVPWLRARPEVLAADTFTEREATVNGAATRLAVIDGAYRGNLTFIEGDEKAAMARMFAGEAVVVSEPFARKLRVGVGSALELDAPGGRVAVTVAGVYADYSRDQGIAMMGSRLFRALWEKERAMSAAVYLQPGADGAALEREFRTAFADEGQFSIRTSRVLRERVMGIFEQTFAVTGILRTVAVIVAIAGVFLSMVTHVTERRRELALMRALGASPGWVGRLVLGEAALLGVAAALLGVLAGIPLAMVLTWVVNPAFFGWTIHFSLPIAPLLWTPVWLAGVAVVAAWWPSRVARSVGIAEALHDE